MHLFQALIAGISDPGPGPRWQTQWELDRAAQQRENIASDMAMLSWWWRGENYISNDAEDTEMKQTEELLRKQAQAHAQEIERVRAEERQHVRAEEQERARKNLRNAQIKLTEEWRI